MPRRREPPICSCKIDAPAALRACVAHACDMQGSGSPTACSDIRTHLGVVSRIDRVLSAGPHTLVGPNQVWPGGGCGHDGRAAHA